MTQGTARMSRAVKVTTVAVLVGTAICAVAALYIPPLAYAATVLMLVSVFCYLTAPVGYELEGGRLTVFTHIGRTVFAPVVGCSRVDRTIYWGVRLFGNGGLFGGTGFFWNPRFGVFRAYVTSARSSDMLMVDTPGRKVLITPEDPETFIASCARDPHTRSAPAG
jgi:hypothetical protein